MPPHTLRGLTRGRSEKRLAAELRLSPHTVHDYIKVLYRHFGVQSRSELVARLAIRRQRIAPPRLRRTTAVGSPFRPFAAGHGSWAAPLRCGKRRARRATRALPIELSPFCLCPLPPPP